MGTSASVNCSSKNRRRTVSLSDEEELILLYGLDPSDSWCKHLGSIESLCDSALAALLVRLGLQGIVALRGIVIVFAKQVFVLH